MFSAFGSQSLSALLYQRFARISFLTILLNLIENIELCMCPDNQCFAGFLSDLKINKINT